MTPGETGLGQGSRLSDTRPSPKSGQGQKVWSCPLEGSPGDGLGCPIGQRRALMLPQLRVTGPPGRQADLSCSLHSVSPMSSSQVRTSDAYLLFYELASPPSRM